MRNSIRLDSRSHFKAPLKGLLSAGWSITAAPDEAKIRRNGQLICLKNGTWETRIRLFAYKVTGSGRGRPHERRIEITSTYQKGLSAAKGYTDVVLGYDPDTNVLVGIDPRRLHHGGPTGNASSFFDRRGLRKANAKNLTVRRMESKLFGIEYQAFFHPIRFAEYVYNLRAIHHGRYNGAGLFSGNTRTKTPNRLSVDSKAVGGDELALAATKSLVRKTGKAQKAFRAFDSGDDARLRKLKISNEELVELNQLRDEIGLKGEEFVVKRERRLLLRKKRPDLASKVDWVSQTYPYEGYDILSYDEKGRRKYIEVKSTTGQGKKFYMSENEWRTARKKGKSFFIYRVTKIYKKPELVILHDPIKLEAAGKIKKNTNTWFVEYL